jgi:hypothetical protein
LRETRRTKIGENDKKIRARLKDADPKLTVVAE